MFRMSDFNFCILTSLLTDWMTFSYRQNDVMCSPYQSIKRLNLEKMRKNFKLVAAVAFVSVIRSVYECIRLFIRTKHLAKYRK